MMRMMCLSFDRTTINDFNYVLILVDFSWIVGLSVMKQNKQATEWYWMLLEKHHNYAL